MFQKRVLVIHPSSAEAERLSRLAQKFGPVTTRTDAEAALPELVEGGFAAVVVDAEVAAAPALRSAVRPPAGVLVTGPAEDALWRAAESIAP